MTLLLRGLLLATVVLFWGEVLILVAARSGYEDPFAPYRGMVPGQPIDAIKGFSCLPPILMSSTEAGFCAESDASNIFQHVLVIDSNHMIAKMVFIVKSNALAMGDLVLCWGEPIYIIDNTNSYVDTPALNVYWSNQVHAHILPHHASTQASYFLPVAAITFERQWREVDFEKLRCNLES